jgi:hypothetical protein
VQESESNLRQISQSIERENSGDDSKGAIMSVVTFPCKRSQQTKQQTVEAIADYRKKQQVIESRPQSLGERFTLIDDVHNPVIQCNACKTGLVFNQNASPLEMRREMQTHKCVINI